MGQPLGEQALGVAASMLESLQSLPSCGPNACVLVAGESVRSAEIRDYPRLAGKNVDVEGPTRARFASITIVVSSGVAL